MRMSPVIPILALLAFGVGWSPPLKAAEVTLRVVEHGGEPLPSLHVRLHFAPSSRLPNSNYWPMVARKNLDATGRAHFDELGPGTYKVSVDLRDRPWISPENNPLRPPPTFTISAGDDQLELEVELFRGFPVRLFLDLPVAAQGFQARFRHVASGAEMNVPLHGDGRETMHRIPQGVWEVEALPIEGFLLVGVVVNRQEWPGTAPILELTGDDLGPDVVFSFTAQSEIEGTVTEINGLLPAVTIRATLLEPGPWQAAALERGVQFPQHIEAPLDELGKYHIYLPQGLWRVEPVGERLLEKTPEKIERSLASGDRLQADFTVEVEPGPDLSSALKVLVLSADPRARPNGAFAAVFEEGTTPQSDEPPLWAGQLHHRLVAAHGLPAGRFEVAVGHENSLETKLSVEYDPGEHLEKLPQAVLQRGGVVKMLATNLEGQRAKGLQLQIERLDELPELLLPTPQFVEAKKRRVMTSDLSGRGTASGFYSGLYRFEARVGGEKRSTGIVEVRTANEDWQPFLELALDASGEVEIEIRQRPAARFAAKLNCRDSWQMPKAIDVLLLNGRSPRSRDPVLDLQDATLAGKHRDRLTLGPLAAGSYALGVRPQGFDRWTWFPAAKTPQKAETLSIAEDDVEERRTLDLGSMQVECGPAVDLLLRVATGDPFPPLHELRMSARSNSKEKEQGGKDLNLKNRGDRLELRGMPRGGQTLEIRLEHPWFLPTTELLWEIPAQLERGMYQEVELEVETLGGALHLLGLNPATSSPLVAARVRRGEFATEVVRIKENQALIPSLLPGPWRVELCPQMGCREPIDFGEIQIVGGETLILRPTS